MSKFESSIKHIPYPQTAVYAMLSDLSNLRKCATNCLGTR